MRYNGLMSFYSKHIRNLSLLLVGLLFLACVPGKPGQFTIIGERQYKRDKTAPSVHSLTPAHETNFVAIDSNLEVRFDEEVKVSPELLSEVIFSIKKIDDSESIDISGSDIVIDGNKLTINPPTDLDGDTEYYVQIRTRALKNKAGITFEGIDKTSGLNGQPSWSFTTISLAGFTVVAPVGNTSESGGTVTFSVALNEAPKSSVVLNFESTDLTEGRPLVSALTFTTSNWSTPQTITIEGEDDVLNDGSQSYEINFTSIVSTDINYSSLTLDSFTLINEDNDDVAPSIISLLPLNTATAVSTNVDLSVTFNENIQKGSGNILIRQYSNNAIARTIAVTHSSVSIVGATATIDLSSLSGVTLYYVEICSTCFSDQSANPNYFAGITDKLTWNFTTRDNQNPLIMSYSPNDNGNGILVSTDITLSFNENIKQSDAWPGDDNFFFIRRSLDHSLLASYDFNSPEITIVGSQLRFSTLANFLESNTSYYIQIENEALSDLAENAFLGISSTTQWNFTSENTSAPVISSLDPAHGTDQVSPLKDVSITFNKTVQAGSGNIYLKRQSDDYTVATYTVPGAGVSVGGITLTLDTSPHFVDLTDYYIEIESGAIVATSTLNNSFAGIAAGNWSFTVQTYKTIREDLPAPVITTQILDYSDDRTLGVYVSGGSVYLYNFTTNSSTLVSKYANQSPAVGTSPRISGNGLYVVYATNAAIAVSEDLLGLNDVYRYDVLLNQNTRITNAQRLDYDQGLGDTSCAKSSSITLDLWCDSTSTVTPNAFSWSSLDPVDSGTIYAHYSDCSFAAMPFGNHTIDLGFAYTESGVSYRLYCDEASDLSPTHSYTDINGNPHMAKAPYTVCSFSQDPVPDPAFVLAVNDASEETFYFNEETRVQYTEYESFVAPDINQDGSIIVVQEDRNDYVYDFEMDGLECANITSTNDVSYSRVNRYQNGLFNGTIAGDFSFYDFEAQEAICSAPQTYRTYDINLAYKPRVSPDGFKIAYFQETRTLRKEGDQYDGSTCVDKILKDTRAYVNGFLVTSQSHVEYQQDESTSTFDGDELIIDNSRLVTLIRNNRTTQEDVAYDLDLYCHPDNEDPGNFYDYTYLDEYGTTNTISGIEYHSCQIDNASAQDDFLMLGFIKHSDVYQYTTRETLSTSNYIMTSHRYITSTIYTFINGQTFEGSTNRPINIMLHPTRDELLFAIPTNSAAPMDSNNLWDVYRSSLNFSTKEVMTLNQSGLQFDHDSGNLMLFYSSDGNGVSFNTKASNVVNNMSFENILVKKAIVPL
jgi:hypothetical protein